MSGYNCLPNLICPGAPKAGTTTLYNLFSMHPDIYVSDYKELYYFSNDKIFSKGLGWYMRNFNGYDGKKYIADVTPFYLASLKAPERMYKQLGGDVKFILMLRNPAERAYSQYLMQYREGKEIRVFEDVISDEYKKDEKGSILNNGLYYKNIKRFMEYYPLDNFHIVLTKDMKTDFRKTAKELFAFLGLDDLNSDIEIDANSQFQPRRKFLFKMIKKVPNRYKIMFRKFFGIQSKENLMRRLVGSDGSDNIPMNEETRKWLQEFYRDDIKFLMELTGKDLSCWSKK